MSIFNKSRVIIANNNSKLYSEMVASASHFLFFLKQKKRHFSGHLNGTDLIRISFLRRLHRTVLVWTE